MRRTHRGTFTTIKTEGNLLPADFLQRIVEGDRELDGLSPESYHLSKNERLNEAINRAWNRCEGVWRGYGSDSAALPESDAGTTITRERWLLPLFQELGYGRLLTSKARVIDGKSYPISHTWHHTPIHLVSFRQDLDRRTPGVAGAAQMSPHSLVQEFLNRSDDQLWGIVSNGLKLRLLRDNASLTRQAYVEFDLEGMMSGEVYSDFVILYMLLHESRVEAERPEQCWLERWTQETQQRGTRALDQLRDGVEKAIAAFGQGFLAHPANSELREKLQSGDLTPHDLYQQILRLVYRLIFLFVAEDRNLLLSPETSPETRQLYSQNYSITRIRLIAGLLRGTRHGDLWQGLKITFRGLMKGESALGLNPLGGLLFSEEAVPDLNDCELSNDALLTAVRQLSFTQDKRVLRSVDYRNLGTEELGSVYESLLELHPEVNVNASTFELKVAAGSERKTTGSYYTPSSLINCLLDSALEPVIKNALKKPDRDKALLNLKVVDPASGSGHFLIAAAHRIGKHLAIIRTGEAEPPPEARREALRDVVSHCIYGVDVNPLAVELCKVALWIETLDPGRPLGFLDHHIKCGNSLIGATPELVEKGIPNDAFKPVEGDDKNIAAAIKKKNEEEYKGQQDLFASVTTITNWQEAVAEFHQWEYMPENAYHQVREKAAKYETLRDKPAYQHEKQVADLWTAAFFWPLTEETAVSVPTEDTFRRYQGGTYELKEEVRSRLEDLALKHRFFHWHLEFPEVFSEGGEVGFDCVLGNPPWEKIKLQEKEFFAQRDREIANAPNAAARKNLISALPETNPGLWIDFLESKRKSECESHFIRASDRYPLNAIGDINTYQIFAGLARQLISSCGQSGMVLLSGIATDDSNKLFFQDLLMKNSLISFYDFENRKGIFPTVQGNVKFCLLTMGGDGKKRFSVAAQLDDPLLLKDKSRLYELTLDDIREINPNTLNCPIFRSSRDAELVKGIHQRIPILVNEQKGATGDPWGISFLRMFDMANDSHLFRTRDQLEAEGYKLKGNVFVGEKCYVPLYEAKLAIQYNHRQASFDTKTTEGMFRTHAGTRSLEAHELKNPSIFPIPRYWIEENHLHSRIPSEWSFDWLIGFRRTISTVADSRSVNFSIFPRYGTSDSIFLLFSKLGIRLLCALYALFNSFVFDYVARQKASGGNLNYYIFKQLPALPPEYFNGSMLDLVLPRVFELTYTSYDLRFFAEDIWKELYQESGKRPPLFNPFIWDEARRFMMRCELDAAFFHFYGIEKEDVGYILETFPIIMRWDEEKYGEYRTKRIILECYDAMAEAMKTDRSYQTILDPPPADPRVAHPPKEGVDVPPFRIETLDISRTKTTEEVETEEGGEEKMSEHEFVARAIMKLRHPPYKAIHSVYSGFNQAFTEYFKKDPVEAIKRLVEEGNIVTRPAKGGVLMYLPEDAPASAQTKSILEDILGEEDPA
ncbi:MAG: Eco57I restriction-modification methylase domain-containing protein [Candidatus Hodarchaeota archaeon]